MRRGVQILASILILAAACSEASATDCGGAPDAWFARYRATVQRVIANVRNQALFCAAKRRQLGVGQAWLAWHLGHPQCGRGNPAKWEEARLRLEGLQTRVSGELAEECP